MTNAYEMVMMNAQRIGNKVFAYAPTETLFVDERFQRVDYVKIDNLVRNWNENKMDALKVSAHPETENFSVIDGLHRLTAAKQMHIPYLAIEIVQLSDNIEERLRQEAKLFATQNDEIDKLTARQRHKANLILGVPENVILQKLVDKYGIKLRSQNARAGVLNAFNKALDIAKSGEGLLDDTFRVIKESRWILNKDGLRKNSIGCVASLLRLHEDEAEKVIKTLIEKLKTVQPIHVFAEGSVKYPLRTQFEQGVLILEDYLHTEIGLEYRFLPELRVVA